METGWNEAVRTAQSGRAKFNAAASSKDYAAKGTKDLSKYVSLNQAIFFVFFPSTLAFIVEEKNVCFKLQNSFVFKKKHSCKTLTNIFSLFILNNSI